MENIQLTQRGRECLIHEGYVYTFDRTNVDGDIKFWRCQAKNVNCKSRLHTRDGLVVKVMNSHNHESMPIGFKMRNVRKKSKKKQSDEGEVREKNEGENGIKKCCIIDPLFPQEDTRQEAEPCFEPPSMKVEETPVSKQENSLPLPPLLPTSTAPLEDEFDIVGKNVAAKLRQLPPTQRIFAERLINEALFEAQLGTLTRDCQLVVNSRNVPGSYEDQELNTVDVKPFV